MVYCKLHSEKVYSPAQVDMMEFCAHAGLYQDVGNRAYIRVYCFADLDKDQREKLCEKGE